MNHRKGIADLSATSFRRNRAAGKLPWSKLYSETVIAVNTPRLTNSAKLSFFLLQPTLNKGSGYLTEELRLVAASLGLEEEKLSKDIDRLIKVDVLRRRDDGIIFDPAMVTDAQIRMGEKVEKGEVLENFPKYSEISEQHSSNDDVSLGSFAANAHSRVEESRVEESKSWGPQSPPTFYSPTSTTETSTSTENCQKNGNGCGLQPPVPFSGLTETDLLKVRKKYPASFEQVYGKFVEYHADKRSASVDPLMLWGWFKRERSTGAPTPGSVESVAATPTTRREFVIR
jgi:hypothetical protein